MKSEKGTVGRGGRVLPPALVLCGTFEVAVTKSKKLLALLRTNWIQIGKLNSDLDGVRPFQTCSSSVNLVKEGVRKSSNTCCVMLSASMLLVLAKREL